MTVPEVLLVVNRGELKDSESNWYIDSDSDSVDDDDEEEEWRRW